jgi:hypothetical protein
MKSRFRLFINTIILTALALSSCTSNKSVIATAVAMTVQAQNTQSASVTDTPLALATIPPLADPTTPGAPTADNPSSDTTAAPIPTITPMLLAAQSATSTTKCYAMAAFVGETVPDGTIFSPGAVFTKTWTIKNSGTCPWDTSWKLVYKSGDVMGAAYVFNMPQSVLPGQTVIIPIVFTAPSTVGTYTGYWMLESPWGCVFGDSAAGACAGTPYSVKIVVSNGTPANGGSSLYGVTSVTYTISIRGCCTCGRNIFMTTYATVTSNGPVKVSYRWSQSDGGNVGTGTINFTEASSQTIEDTWPLSITMVNKEYWEELVITSPVNQRFPNTTAHFDHEC